MKLKLLSLLLFSFVYFGVSAQIPKSYSASEIELQLKKANTFGSVLYIAAHPDDENTRLITYLANEKCLRTGYLSLTRGDGGQNLIGSEQGIELGVIRTQELLAARRTDGGEQFFTRAYDFGYSKTPKETFEKWTHEEILADVVFVIRKFRPDIIITRFATDGSGGHGHHTASAILAEEAFDAAADPTKFPGQLKYVSVWQTKRMFYNNASRFWNPNADMSGNLKVDVGGFNKSIGKSYGEIAAESRSMHRSQGFGSARQRGEMIEYFKPIKGDTGNLTTPFDRIDFTWNVGPNGKKIASLMEAAIKAFRADDIKTCNQKLIEALAIIPDNKEAENRYKRKQITHTLLLVNSVFIEAISDGNFIVSPKDSIKIKGVCLNRSNSNIVLAKVSLQEYGEETNALEPSIDSIKNQPLKNNIPNTTLFTQVLSQSAKPSSLFWLKNEIQANKFDLTQGEIGLAYGFTSGYLVKFELLIEGKSIEFTEPVQYKWADPEKGEQYRPLVIAPPAYINLNTHSLIATDSTAREIKVTVKAGRDNVKGLLLVYTSHNWKIYFKGDEKKSHYAGASTYVELAKKGEEKELIFMVIGPKETNIGVLDFGLVEMPKPIEEVREDGLETVTDQPNDYDRYPNYKCGLKEIKYDHIPAQVLFPNTRVKLVKVDVNHKKYKIGYLPGAGDEVAPCLEQLGYEIDILTNEMLLNGNLSQYKAIITGVRAYNTNEKLSSLKSKLMSYVANGGNLIVQYNTNSFAGPFKADIGPYPFKITRDRITDENAKVVFELPNHPVLNTPNKITDQDFEGWIQERSIYHAGDADPLYQFPISMSDPGEKSSKGALLIGDYGKGHFVYTGIAFFRELPAGVPGAYRLFVNLVELK
ncbi:MAG: LmbE family protein [Bacteroidetes bacterium B1(2017)]|nr:MAG: LmbE family protein [Bacteroidetes bacterium B1(2017)]